MINKEEIEKQKQWLKEWLGIHFIAREDSYMRFNYDDCWNLYQLLKNTDDTITKQENKIKELGIEKDYYKARYLEFNNAFIEGGRKLTKEEITGKAIQEMGTSNLYKED